MNRMEITKHTIFVVVVFFIYLNTKFEWNEIREITEEKIVTKCVFQCYHLRIVFSSALFKSADKWNVSTAHSNHYQNKITTITCSKMLDLYNTAITLGKHPKKTKTFTDCLIWSKAQFVFQTQENIGGNRGKWNYMCFWDSKERTKNQCNFIAEECAREHRTYKEFILILLNWEIKYAQPNEALSHSYDKKTAIFKWIQNNENCVSSTI